MTHRAFRNRVFSGVLLTASICFVYSFAQSSSASTELGTGNNKDVVFDAYPTSAGYQELISRVLSPLQQAKIENQARIKNILLDGATVTLRNERFLVYVPKAEPPQGYGLIAFISPWAPASLPPGWAEVLDRYGVIFVSAAKSDNDQDVVTRRIPLVLIGAVNVASRFRIDPGRVYVGGFSGGARVALRVALDYPDMFNGAFLDAGADPIGQPPNVLPAAALFSAFQADTRLVFLGGEYDQARTLNDDAEESLRDHCVYQYSDEKLAGIGHQLASAEDFGRALARLNANNDKGQQDLTACRARMAARMAKASSEIQKLLADNRKSEARRRIVSFDAAFGNSAGRQIADFSQQCACDIGPAAPPQDGSAPVGSTSSGARR